MCGRFFLQAKLGEIGTLFDVATGDVDDPGPKAEIFPTDPMLAIHCEETRQLSVMRWGMVISGWASGPRSASPTLIRHARAETVFEKPTFRDAGRCVLPISGWHDWAGSGKAKTKLRFTATTIPVLAIAAVWRIGRAKDGTEAAQFAVVTTGPNAEIAEVHHRMPVIVPKDRIEYWIAPDSSQAKSVLHPAPDGMITIEEADPPPPEAAQLSLF